MIELKGKWVIDLGKIYNDDFNHDICLKMSGDFEDYDQKLEYLQLIVDKLND